jgi:arylsulfatase A-like enzyme
MNKWYKFILYSVFVLCDQFCFAQKQDTRPNIIYIMADDMGYADLSCYGRKDYQTPYLDKLCSQGIKLMNAYANAPVCTPTRVALFTGRYPARVPVGLHEPLDWNKQDSTVGLSASRPSLPSLLKKAGYETYLVGKWHLGFNPKFSPLKHGFDEFLGFNGGGIDYISHTDPFGNNDLFENDKLVTKDGYMTDILTDRAVDIIKKTHSKPFFLCVTFNAPHWPWQAPGDKTYPLGFGAWQQGGSPQIYAEMMKSLDTAVGKIVNTVDELNLANNTVIIFTSDNGGERYSDNGIYQGRKLTLWEGGIREPAFVRWPGRIKETSMTNQVVTTFDWTATILSLANATVGRKFPLDGIDLTQILTGQQTEVDRTLYWRISQRRQSKAVRHGKWKWLQDEKGNEYLFDLVSDPGETKDLKTNFPDVFQKLKKEFAGWEKKMLKPLPLMGIRSH